jgi:signal transduction histidine kinase
MTNYRYSHEPAMTLEQETAGRYSIIFVTCTQIESTSPIDKLDLRDYQIYTMLYDVETAPAIVEATLHTNVDAVMIYQPQTQSYNYELCYQLRYMQSLDIPIMLISEVLCPDERIKGLKMGASLCIDSTENTEQTRLQIEHQIESYRQMRHLQDDIRKQQIKFETQLMMKEEFVQTVSHNLKNPLSIIYGSALLLQQQNAFVDTTDKEMLDNILSGVTSIRKLLSNLHNLSRFEEEERLVCERLPFLDFLNNCTESFYAVAKNVEVELTYESLSADHNVEFDRDSMIQAISNLVSNAIKYTPAGGRVKVTGQIDSQAAKVVVADTGIGISDEALPHIFERFYRAASAQQHRGTGLGLAITRAIIERHGGTIGAESKLGEGTTFTLTLPLQQA